MLHNCKGIAFVTPYDQTNRGNATTTLRIKQGYEKNGYVVQTFAYNEGGT